MEPVIDAYLKWGRELRLGLSDEGFFESDFFGQVIAAAGQDKEPAPEFFNPTLVKLHRSEGSDGERNFRNTVSALTDPESGIVIEQGEFDLLNILVKLESELSKEDEQTAILFLPEASQANADESHARLFTEIKRGPPVMFSDRPDRQGTVLNQDAAEDGAIRTFMGVMDDGIPFLNKAFADFDSGQPKSKILSVWLQAIANLRAQPGSISQIGRVISAREIERWYSRDETSVYREVNDQLFSPCDTKTVSNAVSHGSHIMSIAAGGYSGAKAADPSEPLFEPDHVLAVQFEPATVLDTSGRRLDFSVLHGARWMMVQALLKARPREYVPLVINVSYGAAAGPKDGSGFLETALRAEIERYSKWSGLLLGKAAPMRIIFPFGNGYRSNLVAIASPTPEAPLELDWRVQADDLTASYLEVRADPNASLKVCVTPPGGTTQEYSLAPDSDQNIKTGAETIGRVYREPNDAAGRAYYVIACLPTRFQAYQRKAAPAGAWAIKVSTEYETLVSVEVQRDDTPFNYRRNGRQSYLAHPRAYGWDCELRNYSEPLDDSPVTREGTHASNVSPAKRGAYGRGIYSAGAVYRHHIKPDCPTVARYSAAGSTEPPRTNATRPTISAAAETSHGLPGMLALGTRTGSVAALGGTSVAAPQFARHLLEFLAGAGPFSDFDEEVAAFLNGKEIKCPDTVDFPRRGLGLLAPNGVIPRDTRDRA